MNSQLAGSRHVVRKKIGKPAMKRSKTATGTELFANGAHARGMVA